MLSERKTNHDLFLEVEAKVMRIVEQDLLWVVRHRDEDGIVYAASKTKAECPLDEEEMGRFETSSGKGREGHK